MPCTKKECQVFKAVKQDNKEMKGAIIKQWRSSTKTLAAKALEGPLCESVLSAISAEACSACLKVEKKFGLSKTSPLKFTLALKRGA